MYIGAEANVVGQIPANMVGILVDHNLIRIPEPIIAECQIGRSHRPIPAIEPEPARSSTANSPHVTGTKPASKVAMLPWLIEMVVRIAGAGIVPNPLLPFHVRSSRMAGLCGSVRMRSGGFRRAMICRRPV